MAFYPSPAGATESLLNLESWEELIRNNPILQEPEMRPANEASASTSGQAGRKEVLEPDVEALLINRVRDTREYYIVPIDACYQLVGLIRLSWKGLSGGEEAWKAISGFFEDVRARSRPVNGDLY